MKKATKAHLISHVLSSHGPLTRAEVLERVSTIEGKPFRRASNRSYFTPFANYDHANRHWPRPLERQSLVFKRVIKVVGKRGRELVYGLDAKGLWFAAEYRGFINS